MALWNVGPLGQLTDDPDAYRIIAETLARTGTFGIAGSDGSVDPTAFRPPLYPWLLSWFVSEQGLNLSAVAALHALLGAITAVATALAAACWAGELRFTASESPVHSAVVHSAGVRVGLLAGLLVAVDPLLLMQSTLVMTETLATAITAVAWMMIALAGEVRRCQNLPANNVPSVNNVPLPRRGFWRTSGIWLEFACWLAVGLALAAGFLCRPTFVVWTFGLVVVLAANFSWKSLRHRKIAWRELGIVILILLTSGATVLGWMERNRQVIGKPVWATTHGGYTLLLGNNPYFYQYLEQRSFAAAGLWGDAWEAEPFHQEWQQRQERLKDQLVGQSDLVAGEDILAGTKKFSTYVDYEIYEDQLAAEWSKDTIRQQPGMFAYSSLVRVARLWTPVPRVGQRVSAVSLVLGCYYTLIYIACIAVTLRFGWNLMGWSRKAGGETHGFSPRAASWVGFSALLLVCSLTLVHAVYWSNVRMRAPAMPMILGLGSLVIAGGSASPLGRGKH